MSLSGVVDLGLPICVDSIEVAIGVHAGRVRLDELDTLDGHRFEILVHRSGQSNLDFVDVLLFLFLDKKLKLNGST